VLERLRRGAQRVGPEIARRPGDGVGVPRGGGGVARLHGGAQGVEGGRLPVREAHEHLREGRELQAEPLQGPRDVDALERRRVGCR